MADYEIAVNTFELQNTKPRYNNVKGLCKFKQKALLFESLVMRKEKQVLLTAGLRHKDTEDSPQWQNSNLKSCKSAGHCQQIIVE